MTASNESRFLTLEEVGDQVRLRKSRVAELANTGAIPTVRVGRRYLVPRQWLDDLETAAMRTANVSQPEQGS